MLVLFRFKIIKSDRLQQLQKLGIKVIPPRNRLKMLPGCYVIVSVISKTT